VQLEKPPQPKVKRRRIHPEREKEALESGLDPLIAKIIAARPFLEKESPKALLSPKLKSLDNPKDLKDIDKAVMRLVQALENNEIIGIETDHDCDGQTSHAVIYTALIEFFGHPSDKVRSYIGHRLNEGYGLSLVLAERILADEPRPTLIITADNGSSDEAQIAILKQAGIDVIVTDHHEIPSEGIPKSAIAVINPTREDCQFGDCFIAGCMVAWLLMAATRQKLMTTRNNEIPSLASCLDFVAVGTIADCVSIARSRNNRAVVSYGMKLIEQGVRPCWRAVLPLVSTPLSSEDLGYKIGPLLNSDGRLSSAFGSVSFLLAPDDKEAKLWVTYLQNQNAERKSIQHKITQLAMKAALKQYHQGIDGLCIFLEDGHAGVHGISASRIKDMFGRPVIILCPKIGEANLLTGSARSIEGVHLKEVLQEIHNKHPQLIVRFGGHQGAAGLSIDRENYAAFAAAFDQVIKEKITPEKLGPVIWTDGELSMDNINVPFIDKLVSQLEPFGREFESVVFEVIGNIVSLTPMGQTQTHARVGISIEDEWLEAVWFNARETSEEDFKVALGVRVKVVFSPKVQTFRSERKLSCQIVHIEVYSH